MQTVPLPSAQEVMGSQDAGLAEFVYVASLISRKDLSFMEEMINVRNGMKSHSLGLGTFL